MFETIYHFSSLTHSTFDFFSNHSGWHPSFDRIKKTTIIITTTKKNLKTTYDNLISIVFGQDRKIPREKNKAIVFFCNNNNNNNNDNTKENNKKKHMMMVPEEDRQQQQLQ